jgi:hypothetical protein
MERVVIFMCMCMCVYMYIYAVANNIVLHVTFRITVFMT